jgi:F0F1-type ATP synthase assembly protein I
LALEGYPESKPRRRFLNAISRSEKESKDFKEKRLTGRLMIVGTNFIAGVSVLGYLGHLLDNRLGYEYRYMAIGASLGILWALYEAIKLALWLSRDEPSKGGNGSADG